MIGGVVENVAILCLNERELQKENQLEGPLESAQNQGKPKKKSYSIKKGKFDSYYYSFST